MAAILSLGRWINKDLLVHVFPSPWKPKLQVQSKPPSVSMQVASAWQSCLFKVHSSSSAEKYIWWRHKMETFPSLLALCEENPPVTGWFPSHQASNAGFDILFEMSAQTNGWTNSWVVGVLERNGAHLMSLWWIIIKAMKPTSWRPPGSFR